MNRWADESLTRDTYPGHDHHGAEGSFWDFSSFSLVFLYSSSPPQKVGRPPSIHPHLIPGPPPTPLRSQTSESEGITDHIQGITDHIGLSRYKQWLNRVRSEHMVLKSLIFSLSIHGFTFQWGIILDRNDDARLQMYISQVGDLNEDGEYVAWLMTNKSRSHRHRWCHHRHIRDYHHQERDLQISSGSPMFLNMV